MITRRTALGLFAAPAVFPISASPSVLRAASLAMGPALAALRGADERGSTPMEDAGDEDLWAEVARAFPLDRAVTNLNNGGVSPAPGTALEALRRYQEEANTAPAYTLWRTQEPRREAVRQQMASAFGAAPEELAFTRNASESLEILQFGFDLKPGDRVVCADQDYPRMLAAFEQRQRREAIELVKIPLPTAAESDEEVLEAYAAAIDERTKLVLCSHAIFLTGQVLPVQRLTALCRERKVPLLVDGAHAFAHLDFNFADLDVDYYATSLHKWLCAPHGNGLLYMRQEKIRNIWPLMAAWDGQEADIRKFEEIGTHSAAPTLAVAESLAFHQAIGQARKLARLYHLRDLWLRPLLATSDRLRLHTSLTPGRSTSMACLGIDGLEPPALAAWLWDRHRILVTNIAHPQFSGIRVSPSIYTTPQELARFTAALSQALEHGI